MNSYSLAAPQLAGTARVPQLGASWSPFYSSCAFGGRIAVGDAGDDGSQDVAMSIVCRSAHTHVFGFIT